jgi:hypothetical protein
MDTENRYNSSTVHLNIGHQNCKHPMLQPTLTKSGFHTGIYVCIKCDKIIQDTLGTLMIQELSF